MARGRQDRCSRWPNAAVEDHGRWNGALTVAEKTPRGQGKKYKWLQTEKGKAYIKRHNRTGAERQRRYRERHGDRYREMHAREQREWRATAEGKRQKKNLALKKAYGITLEQFEAIAKLQGGKCAICAGVLDMGFFTHVDHCHATGDVRGLLCSPCNTSLGCFKDSVEMLQRAISYLERKGTYKCL